MGYNFLAFVPFVFVIIGIMYTDLLYKFGNRDIPFILVLVLYTLFVRVGKFSSKITISVSCVLVICMGVAYAMQGPVRLTERIGEWFYLFFVFSLIQYIYEMYRLR